MYIKPIHHDQDYEDALKRIEFLMDAKPNTEEADELEVLSTLVEAYEEKNFPIELPDPIEAIKFRMEQSGITRKELEHELHCTRGRVSEILNKKRPLNLNMIRVFTERYHIPSDVLVKEYTLIP